MNFIAGNQAITTDWVEMHFRMKDQAFFAHPRGKNSDQFREQTEDKSRSIDSGKALPKTYQAGRDKIHIGHTTFKRHMEGNKFYIDCYKVWHRNKEYGILFARPRQKGLLPLDDIQIKVLNNKLYEKTWLDDLKIISEQIGATFHNFTKLDIAVDGGKFLQLEKLWQEKKLIKTGRAAVNTYYNNKGVATGFYIGKSQSKKRMKIYNKTAELKKSNKLYIERFWKANGIDPTQVIERLELSIRNEEMKKFDDIDWRLLDDHTHLASIMRSNMDKFCDFRIPSADKNISRMKKVEIVNWNQLQGEMLPKDTTRPTTEIFSAKVTIKKNFECFLKSGVQVYHDCAFEIAINTDLVEYFNKMQPKWIEDFKTKCGENADGIISDSWITRFKTYKASEQIHIFDDVQN